MSLAVDILRTLQSYIADSFPTRIKRVRVANDTVIAQNINVMDIPLCALWTMQEEYQQGEIADTKSLTTSLKVMLITQAPSTDEAAFNDQIGILPLSRDLITAIEKNKTLGDLVTGLDLTMRIDDFDVQAQNSMGNIIFSGVGRNIYLDYKKHNLPWDGWRMNT